MGNTPNQMNIQSMYSDIDLDANDMENEFQAALELLMEFVSEYKGQDLTAQFVFNRDLPVNQGEVINNCRNSTGILFKCTIVANHLWTLDTDEELKEYIKLAKREILSDKHTKMLENTSIRVRLAKSQELYIRMAQFVEELANKQNLGLSDVRKDVCESGTYKTAYETQRMSGKFSEFDAVPRDAIE